VRMNVAVFCWKYLLWYSQRIFWNISTRLPDYNDSHLRVQYTSNYRTVYFCKT